MGYPPIFGNSHIAEGLKSHRPLIIIDNLSLNIKLAQEPYIIGSVGPKALKDEPFEGKGID